MLERLFRIREQGSTVKVELLGGLTTFLTMAYIIFLNPAIISKDFVGNPTGLSFDAALLATCLAAGIATIIMGVLANYPIAQAPGMGENFFFVSVVMALGAMGVADSWRVALGIVFISGVIFLILSLFKFRKVIIEAVSPNLKNGIAVGIGLFIAFLGLKDANVIISSHDVLQLNPDILKIDFIATPMVIHLAYIISILCFLGALAMLVYKKRNVWVNILFLFIIAEHVYLVRIGVLDMNPDFMIFMTGLIIMATLAVRKVRGSILIGIFASTFIALIWGATKIEGIFGLPKDHAFLALDIKAAFSWRFVGFIVVFLFMDLFDTMGTLIGVGEQAGFMKNNKLPRANKALISDAAGTVVGSLTGTSTVTSFIESVVGVEYGARTGLASVMTGILFLLAIFLTPLAASIGNYSPITAPALVIVGAMMMSNVRKIDWKDYSESIPAFLAMVGIPFTFSIHNGLALGFISYPVIKLLSGKGREVSWLIYVVALLFVARYVFISG